MTPPPVVHGNPDGPRILVVDDQPEIRRFLRAALADDGYAVREAANGADAYTVARNWRPDLIVLDLMMPVMNGWQFAETISALPGPTAPIVVLTAAGPRAIRSAATLGPITAVLPKPLDLDELRHIISLHLARQAA